jgi:hypothetical protein
MPLNKRTQFTAALAFSANLQVKPHDKHDFRTLASDRATLLR